ncbi:MAG: hypothetical protein ACE5IO_05945, partial [Thermoplasmata archaeon]
ITLGLCFGDLLTAGLFILVALIVAIPLRVLISMRRRQYERRRRAWGLGPFPLSAHFFTQS